jgi:hypothetical protein
MYTYVYYISRTDRPWGPLSLLYSGYRVFPGGKAAGLTTHPLLVPWSRMSRAIPLLPLWAFGAFYKVNFTLCVCVCARACVCVCVCVCARARFLWLAGYTSVTYYQYSESNMMHFLFNLLRIKGL